MADEQHKGESAKPSGEKSSVGRFPSEFFNETRQLLKVQSLCRVYGIGANPGGKTSNGDRSR
jgi:hypothetical protein